MLYFNGITNSKLIVGSVCTLFLKQFIRVDLWLKTMKKEIKSAKKIVSFFHETTFNSQIMLMVEMNCIMFRNKHEEKT